MFLFLVTPCLVLAVQPCMEWIPIKKNKKSIASFIIICPRSVFPAFFLISSAVDKIACKDIAKLPPLCPLRILCLLGPIFGTYFVAIPTFSGSSPYDTIAYFAKIVLLLGSVAFFGIASLLKRIVFLGISYPSTSTHSTAKMFFLTTCKIGLEPIDPAADISIGFARGAFLLLLLNLLKVGQIYNCTNVF